MFYVSRHDFVCGGSGHLVLVRLRWVTAGKSDGVTTGLKIFCAGAANRLGAGGYSKPFIAKPRGLRF
ncbi:MAG: hypothetical protein ABIF87_07285 [Pseudomonadota bacterium]